MQEGGASCCQAQFGIKILFLCLSFRPIVFLQDRQRTVMNTIPAQSRQQTQDLQARNRLLESPKMTLRRVSGLEGFADTAGNNPNYV